MGLHVQAYNQSTANFLLSAIAKGAPSPFKARFTTVESTATADNDQQQADFNRYWKRPARPILMGDDRSDDGYAK